jgi:hypothetical protein
MRPLIALLCLVPAIAAAEPVGPDEDTPQRMRFAGSVESGFVARQAMSERLLGGAFALELGVDDQVAGVGAKLDLQAGRTEHGLPFTRVSLGPNGRFIHGRWRVSLGIHVGWLVFIDAPIAPDPQIYSILVGAQAGVSCDLLRARRSPYVALRGGLDVLLGLATIDTPRASGYGLLAFGYRF